ncbi:hypothetical protein P154DRAFT_152081 [Amniculicola lignicola CBS 123094]|uniref:Uncharacterized protein n=1 Tax=Amniculicola lignicola CBS 123094 TaxID=1392246 RepID=A0A6A5WPR6_9PLEO|nr:hypothetical protein P154DRAFT_152081 [Amniculicola lignicola CBS 123094]
MMRVDRVVHWSPCHHLPARVLDSGSGETSTSSFSPCTARARREFVRGPSASLEARRGWVWVWVSIMVGMCYICRLMDRGRVGIGIGVKRRSSEAQVRVVVLCVYEGGFGSALQVSFLKSGFLSLSVWVFCLRLFARQFVGKDCSSKVLRREKQVARVGIH